MLTTLDGIIIDVEIKHICHNLSDDYLRQFLSSDDVKSIPKSWLSVFEIEIDFNEVKRVETERS